jgi:hypothetical protein
MTINGSPLALTIKQDAADGFRATGNYDRGLALERAGAVNVERNAREEFEICLIDKRFHWGRPAIINLNLNGVFDVVQSCLTAWEEALDATKSMRPSAAGGQKPYRPYEEGWDEPVDVATFRKLGGKLAVAGDRLFRGIFEKNRGTPLDEIAVRLRELARSGACALTVNAADFHIPWRMLYTHPHQTEVLADDGANFDPAGFWGYQHIVEQYTKRYYIRDHVLAHSGKVAFGAALHERIDTDFNVECLTRHRDFIQASTNQILYTEWTKKAELIGALSGNFFNHQILYFLCHAEAAGTGGMPTLQPSFLELADGKINAVDIRSCVSDRFEPSPPLIFINACRGGQLGTIVRHNFTIATELLEQGAVCVVGPQIEVPAAFAGEFGKRFFEQFIAKQEPPPRVGLVLRELTREMWLHHNPFGLVYSLYAGADCHIRWG